MCVLFFPDFMFHVSVWGYGNPGGKIKKLYKEFTQAEDQIIQKIYENGLVEKSEIISLAKLSRFSQYNEDVSAEENLKNPIFAASYHNAIKKQFPKEFEIVNERYHMEIEKLKQQISKL